MIDQLITEKRKKIVRSKFLRNGKKWESACTTNLKEKRKVCKYAVFKKHLIRDRYTCRNCDIHADFTELHNLTQSNLN